MILNQPEIKCYHEPRSTGCLNTEHVPSVQNIYTELGLVYLLDHPVKPTRTQKYLLAFYKTNIW